MTIMSVSRFQDPNSSTLRNTNCSRGHVHPPWNTKGVLRISKCESVCGFCQKETKTAANLRKHVAIHIKNEGLRLTIAEGSSGRGRLEMPPSELERRGSTTSINSIQSTTPPRDTNHNPNTITAAFSNPSSLISMSSISTTPSPISHPHSHQTHQHHQPQHQPYHYHHPQPQVQNRTPDPSPLSIYSTQLPLPASLLSYRQQSDPFYTLRSHNLSTKQAWTAIPAAEGQRILDICKRDSQSIHSSPRTTHSSIPGSATSSANAHSHSIGGSTGTARPQIPEAGIHLPCYNRKVLYDEEWQAHMKNVHGVYLLWPDTWMKRVEVLDLDPFGGDIGACNGVIMDG